MGLLPDFQADEAGNPLDPMAWYHLERQHLPRKILLPDSNKSLQQHFRGDELLALREQHFENPQYLKAAKRFSRLWLDFYGMGRDLHTREIFAAVLAEA